MELRTSPQSAPTHHHPSRPVRLAVGLIAIVIALVAFDRLAPPAVIARTGGRPLLAKTTSGCWSRELVSFGCWAGPPPDRLADLPRLEAGQGDQLSILIARRLPLPAQDVTITLTPRDTPGAGTVTTHATGFIVRAPVAIPSGAYLASIGTRWPGRGGVVAAFHLDVREQHPPAGAAAQP